MKTNYIFHIIFAAWLASMIYFACTLPGQVAALMGR